MIAGIDSMVLIYAGVVPSKKGSTVNADLILRAKLLLHQLRKDTIVLPTVAIAELLVPVPASQKGILIARLSEKFVCPTLDLRAAAIAAELWADHNKLPKDAQYTNRHVLRSDAYIIASAKAAGATLFFSHDKKCRTLAGLAMTAKDLPKDDHTDMFIKKDIERGEV